jgi:hypothetical protein
VESSSGDLSAGCLVTYKKKFYFGTYLFHLNEPNIGIVNAQKIYMRKVLHLSYSFNLSEKENLQISYRLEASPFTALNQFAVNAILRKHIILGVGASTIGELMANVGFRNNFLSVVAGFTQYSFSSWFYHYSTYELHTGFYITNSTRRGARTNFENW